MLSVERAPPIWVYSRSVKLWLHGFYFGYFPNSFISFDRLLLKSISYFVCTGTASANEVCYVTQKWLTQYNNPMRKAVEVIRAEIVTTIKYVATAEPAKQQFEELPGVHGLRAEVLDPSVAR